MARASSAAVQAATNALTALATFISLASGDPGTTGANEITTGSGHQSLTWGAANSSGQAANTNAPAVALPASTTASFFSTWNSVTAGTSYEVGGALGSSITTGATAGTVTFAVGAVTLITA